MADSDDSGSIVHGDTVRLLRYEKYVVICNSCKHVLFHSNEAIQRSENWTSFLIDVLTVSFDPEYVVWRCRNCKFIISSDVPDAVVQRNMRANHSLNHSVLSHSATSRRFATFEMVDA